MRLLATLCLFIVISISTALAQTPLVSYMFPDIGAPGMNTYVEIIGPWSAFGNFGNQDVEFDENRPELRVEPVDPAHNAFIVVGPYIVSWEGRMIATQVFVKPGTPVGRYDLRVVLNGNPSAPIPFEVINPQPLNGVPGNVLGTGARGTANWRSPRGAMLVSSINLPAGNYTVSRTADLDPTAPGLQQYLPLVLLSRGPVVLNNGVNISLDASNRDGAVGGGGGGGQTCDAVTLGGGGSNTGTGGGNGYTGGSWGGRNDRGVFPSAGPGIIHSNGAGTGPNLANNAGASSGAMNGAPGGKDISSPIQCYPEGSAGGTGHPFGDGGTASCGGTQTGAAGHGGAGGAADNSGGAGGNYAGTAGTAGGVAGIRHGNKHGVPLAGGSGGGGGNPQGSGVCAGEGGGGGGAIAIFSQERMSSGAFITVRGANGGAGGAEGGGGAGSGGMVIIGAKDTLATGGTLWASAGAGGSGTPAGGNGGQGRLRYDGFVQAGNEPLLNDFASSYIGPTIDTLTYVDQATFRIWGTCEDLNNSFFVWIKGDNAFTTWRRLAGPGAPATVRKSGRRWYLDITVPARGIYYIVAGQEENQFRNTDRWERTPPTILSQAAANMIFADLMPKINRDFTQRAPTLVCEQSVVDSFKIVNTGSAELVVQNPTNSNAAEFQITSPAFPIRIPAMTGTDTPFVWVKYIFSATSPGTKTVTFTFVNNDPRSDGSPTNPYNPLVVTITGRKLNFNPSLSRSTLPMPDVCVDSTSTASLDFIWNTDSTGSIFVVEPVTPNALSPFSVVDPTSPTFPRTPAGGRRTITMRFRPRAVGPFSEQWRVIVDPCDTLFFTISGNGLALAATVNPDPIRFGSVKINPSPPPSQTVTVTSTGTADALITNVYFRPPNAALSHSGLVGRTARNGVPVSGSVTFTPTTLGPLPPNQVMCITLGGACSGEICVPIEGEAITSLLRLSRRTIDLRAETCADPAPEEVDTLTLTNLGAAAETIRSITALNGLVNVTTNRPVPGSLQPGDTMLITIRWTPGVTGTDIVRVLTSSVDPLQAEMDITVNMLRDRSQTVVLDSAGVPLATPPAEVDFGSLFACDLDREIRFIVRSLGNITENMAVRFVDGSAFRVAPGPIFQIIAGTEITVRARFVTSGDGLFRDTLIIRNELCNTEVRIPVVGRRTGLSYTATDVAFGQSNVGVPTAKVATFTFEPSTTNTERTVIRSVFITPAGSPFTITNDPTPITLAPGEVARAEVTYTPPDQQSHSAQIAWVLDSPCKDTIYAALSGEGVQSNLLIRRTTLDFGPHFFCEQSELDLVVENVGNAPVDITALQLGGPDAAAFVQVTPVSLPFTLTPGQTLTVTYRFDATATSTDGLKTATVDVQSNDATRPSMIVTLLGERRRQVLQSPANVNFGIVDVGQSDVQDVFLYNRSDVPLTIDSYTISPPYSVDSPTFPVTIPPSPGSITVRIRYTPTDSVQSDAQFIAHYSDPCIDSVIVDITGRGRVILVGSAELAIPDSLKGAPGDLISIPIILERGSLIRESGATTFRSTVRFRKTMLYPTGVRAGTDAQPKVVTGMSTTIGRILSSTIDGDDRVVEFEVTNTPIPNAPDTIAFIDATVLLGDRLTTTVTFDTLEFTDGSVLSITNDGLFTLVGYCEVGTNRLVRISGAAGLKSIAPNPFNPTAEIVFETSESGPTTLVVYDAQGREVARLIDAETLPVGPHALTWNASDHASGIYYIELRTPTERSIERAVLVK